MSMVENSLFSTVHANILRHTNDLNKYVHFGPEGPIQFQKVQIVKLSGIRTWISASCSSGGSAEL